MDRSFARHWLPPVAAVLVVAALTAPAAAAAPAGAAGAVLATFLQNLTRWFEYLASLVAVATVAYGGLRHAAAHSARAQADAWRIVLGGIGGLVIALLAPTIVAIVTGLIPT
ncbi:MAG TPA: TrbC/VirB2 family protein [Bacillota bacterium]|nr:TrbC/VirB2 family protein [Bacillota bacterium]